MSVTLKDVAEAAQVSISTASRALGGGGPPRREKVDPWFLKPYEPTKAAVPAPSAATAGGSITKAKPKLAFLLGGAPKQ